jgi:hypothetical protein
MLWNAIHVIKSCGEKEEGKGISDLFCATARLMSR